MSKWTKEERAIITDIFSSLDYNDVGPKALRRCLVVYPWTGRYFTSFGDLSTPDLIASNQKVADHGIKVLHGLDTALKNMDNIASAYTALSKLHSEKLHVDPDNFRLLGDCLTVVVASKMGAGFTPAVQSAFQKFLNVVVAALGKQYH